MVELDTPLIVGAVGMAVGGVVAYLVFYSRPRAPRKSSLEPIGTGRAASVPASELEHSRREMRTLMVERDLLSSALMKVYEAESDGRISTEEREMITKRYSDQIKGIQAKLKDVELVVEVGELEKLREELVGMFQDKIQNIEGRLDQARERLGVVAQMPPAKETPQRVERATDLEKAVQRRARPEMSESEKRVREIRNEVMDALTRLEQIDTEKKPQDSG